ncbi:hypothetical protein MCGE09_00178 [Thaumarchaeota archaeon SCGC AB-539-E09]|nr:hypothetical protein MCGE09_00178 [Thaumarchaeota archaeon SCGC AB-539-E09]
MSCDSCLRRADWDIFASSAEESTLDGIESSIKGHIMDALTTACFHFREDWELGPDEKPAEYLVDIDFDLDLYDDWIKPNGQKVLKSSKLTVALYYNGSSSKELVQQWIREKPERDYGDLRPESLPGPGNGLSFVLNGMCDNSKSILRQLRPIEQTVLYDFEKKPLQCDVELSEDELCPGDESEVTINNLLDLGGAQSREFNRIVVHALEGKILGGTPLDIDPEYKAFLVKDGTIKFTYKAPTGGGVPNDKLYIYNSCDISRSDQYNLSRTLTRDKIEEANVEIKDCYEAIAEINWREVVTERGERSFSGRSGSSKQSREYRSEIEATFNMMFEEAATIPMFMNSEYYEYYFVKKIALSDFKATLSDKVYNYSSDSKGWNDQTNTYDGRSTNPRIPEPLKKMYENAQMMVIFDAETKKAKAVLLPNPSLDYDFTINMVQVVIFEDSQGHREFSHENTEHNKKGLTVGIVNESNSSSPTSFQYSPDYLVTSGDGVNYMAGSGKMSNDECPHSEKDYTKCKTERTFSWKFSKKLKTE